MWGQLGKFNMRGIFYETPCRKSSTSDISLRNSLAKVQQLTSTDCIYTCKGGKTEFSDEKDFRIAKVLRKLSADEFQIHYYATNSKAKDMSKRAYYPNWGWDIEGKNYEKCCKDKPNDDAYPNETTFKLDELLFEPFHLTKHNHVPREIIEKLYLNGFMCLILEIGDAVNPLKRKFDDVDEEDD